VPLIYKSIDPQIVVVSSKYAASLSLSVIWLFQAINRAQNSSTLRSSNMDSWDIPEFDEHFSSKPCLMTLEVTTLIAVRRVKV
jgi:hypothetical protein